MNQTFARVAPRLLLSFASLGGLSLGLQSCSGPSETTSVATGDQRPPIGKPAPDFTLPDLDGKDVKLSDYQGKFVVLEWFGDECPFIKKHYDTNNMQTLQKECKKKGAVWLTICSSAQGRPGFHSAEEHKSILKKWNAEMSDFLIDANGQVGHMYASKNTPTMYIIGKDGTLIYEGAIDDKPDPYPDSVKGANNYVRAALDEAIAGKNITITTTTPYG